MLLGGAVIVLVGGVLLLLFALRLRRSRPEPAFATETAAGDAVAEDVPISAATLAVNALLARGPDVLPQEAHMPRWRRPSVLAGRRGQTSAALNGDSPTPDSSFDVSAAPPTFPVGSEREVVPAADGDVPGKMASLNTSPIVAVTAPVVAEAPSADGGEGPESNGTGRRPRPRSGKRKAASAAEAAVGSAKGAPGQARRSGSREKA